MSFSPHKPYNFKFQIDEWHHPSLQSLSYLQILHLNDNTFHFEIPTWLWKMTSLVSLRITNANLNGSLSFGSLSWIPNLKRIYFRNNKILGKVSLILQEKWKKMALFKFPNNSLYDSVTCSMGNLISLALISLKSNMLNGRIP